MGWYRSSVRRPDFPCSKFANSHRPVSCLYRRYRRLIRLRREMNVVAASAPLPEAQVTEAAAGGTATAAAAPHHDQTTPAASSPAALWSPTDPPIRPPPTVQHPLHLLEEFLGSLPEEEDEANNDDDGQETTQEQDQSRRSRASDAQNEAAQRTRRILRMADFLYGPSSSSSSGGTSRTVLDNALELLDGGYGAVRCYRARPSGRVAYVVRGSRSAGSGGGGGTRSGDYLCFLHEMAGSNNSNSNDNSNGNSNGNSNDNDDDGTGCEGGGSSSDSGCFCPCRSFFERTKADRRAVCKHLLAARLGPYLRVGYEEYEVSDVQFAHLVLQHSFLAGG